MTIIAIDYGEKRVGAAIGNTELLTVVPIPGLTRKKRGDEIEFIQNLIKEYDPGKILIGNPLNMDGTKSKFSNIVERFSRKLRSAFSLDVELVDERLSSFEAEEILSKYNAGVKKKKRMVDSLSAMIILKRYLSEK